MSTSGKGSKDESEAEINLREYKTLSKPICGNCKRIATTQTAKGKYAEENNHLPRNWGYYCKWCYAKGLEIEKEAMYGE